MKTSILIILLAVLTVQSTPGQSTDTITDGPADTSLAEMEGLVFSENGEDVEIGNFWDLVSQAGPIRYPIFGIFLVGIFLISLKSIELIVDKRRAMALENISMRDMDLNDVSGLVAKQTDTMLSRISSTLLNVYQTSKNSDSLHDEVANFIRFQQDNFNTFRSRIDFLSDTAGALGLLGTVWGMFIVFSSGNLEREIILTGMGIALLTTLLGLVVSIALNFSSTLAYGYFMKRLDQVKGKAEEIRFRLLEIQDGFSRNTLTPKPAVHPNNNHHDYQDSELYFGEEPDEEVTIATKVEPAHLRIVSHIKEAVVDNELADIKVSVTDHHAKAAEDVTVELAVTAGDGTLNKTEVITDASGNAFFNWKLGQKPGLQTVDARVKDSEEKGLVKVLEVTALVGEPKQLLFRANNQSGLPGKKLKTPLITEIRDKFGNPIEGCNVHLEVTTGNGQLGKGEESVVLTTNQNGEISIPFTLDNEPGFNTVDVSVKKAGLFKKYQALGQEVSN